MPTSRPSFETHRFAMLLRMRVYLRASRLKPTDRALILLCHAPKKLSIFFVVTELDPVIHPLIGTLARMDGYAGQAL
jgi:hypothetical protein